MRELDVLVHPFFPRHQMPRMLSVYKRRIDLIARRSGHHLLIELPAAGEGAKGSANAELLVEYARKKLTPKRVIVHQAEENFHDGASAGLLARRLKSIGFNPDSSRVNFYGEYVDECVTQHAFMLAPRLVSPERRKVGVRILLEYSGSRNLSGYTPSHASMRNKEGGAGLLRWHVREALREIQRTK